MSDRNDILRKLAGVRRDLEKLQEEASTAEGAMPNNPQLTDEAAQNFRMVVKRLESVEETAADTAE
ncbi:MAG: hypothetical protein ABEN55_24205, partial [Bradymonadaceae bacterium]